MSTVYLAIAASSHAVIEQLSPGCYLLDGALEVAVVTHQDQLGRALQALRAQVAPRNAVAIDLEWRPDFWQGDDNPVALVQLAADELCVLVRTCLLSGAAQRRGYRLSQRPGLSELSEKILGILPPKNKAVTLPNWAQPHLLPDQIRYAAVDAALVWHMHSKL
eukprot:scaffold13.g411.t1